MAELDGEYFTHSVTAGGDDLTAHTRFTGTWVLDDDEWVCLTHHGTLYEPPADVAYEVLCRQHHRRRLTAARAKAVSLAPEPLPFG